MSPKDRLRSNMIRMLEELEPTILLTVVLGSSRDPFLTGSLIEELLQRIERRAHGKRWANYPTDLRLCGIAFLEHPHSYPHWHCVLRGSPEIEAAALESAISLWRGLVKNGHGNVQLIANPKAVSRYVTKELAADWSFEHWLAYRPDRKR